MRKCFVHGGRFNMAIYKMATLLAVSLLLISGVHSVKVVQQNHEDITAKLGEQVELICTADVDAEACSFRTPKGKTLTMFSGVAYDEGRIKQKGNTKKDCGLEITDVRDKDNGEWECTVTGKDLRTNEYATGTGVVKVTVAVPPSEVYLQVDQQRLAGSPFTRKLENNPEISVECVATGARPAPTFNWYIGQTLMQANTKVREVVAGNKKNYISTMTYFPAAKHNGQELKCEVAHLGYSKANIASMTNWATTDLQLEFKPETRKKETFYKMKEGQANDVRIKFRANPKPSQGVWNLGTTKVNVGTETADQKFKSSEIQDSDLEGEYQVVLTIKTMDKMLAKKGYTLEVTNELGTTIYQFDLALSDAPPKDVSKNGAVIGIVILVVLIIVVAGITIVARAKGILCFTAKSGELPLEEEKEAFDQDPEKGELNAKPPVAAVSGGDGSKNTPDKKPAAGGPDNKPATENKDDNKEEKKSNGAHTPV